MDDDPFLTCENSTQANELDMPDHALKVATRVRIPLGLPTKDQFSGHNSHWIFVLAILPNTRTQHKTQQGSGEFDGRKHSFGQ